MISKTFSKISLRASLITGCAAIALAASSIAPDFAFAAGQGSGEQAQGGGQGNGQGGAGKGAGGQGGRGGQGLGGIFRDLTGMDAVDPAADDGSDDSDRPEWAGQAGGKDGAGGGQPPTSGSKKGDDFGDLFVILRYDDGVPILTAEGWVQPLDVDGNLIPLDDEGHPLDESLTVEVELGRLNVGRAPTSVLDKRADEVITLLNSATDLSVDAAGRLVLTVDGVAKTIDSPLENLAIYVALMTDGSIPGVDDLPGTEYDFLVDGTYTTEDLAASAVFLAAATDKTSAFTTDEIAYIDLFLGINTVSTGDVTYSVVDYSSFSYDRSDTYDGTTVEVLVEQPDGSFVPTVIDVFETVFGSVDVTASGDLAAYTTAADDARTVVNFIHEFEVPSL
ncbi:hypothetical protein ACFFUT_00055 [Pseudohalocynthiibacter aestuariivivens]|uniref:Uncharacterized protein n=1 Tax=Pseudohalocynthiibacter aestuariivivens TaxID=1591409 RepID=A0ABV5J9P5_9RHOB|nr:hypothetical protein [Pseudohalocynthiibacter aestuariivivens]MBS9718927.1 hypothetical protein [Pseudohalocynthiibacter aestuariivivens]